MKFNLKLSHRVFSGILVFVMLFSVIQICQAATTEDDYFFNVSDMSAGEYKTETQMNGFTLIPASDTGSAITVDSNSKTSSATGLKYSKRLKLGGVGSASTRAIKFTTLGESRFCMDVVSSSSKETRTGIVVDANGDVVATTSIGKNMAYTKFYLPDSGEYTFYSLDGGVNIYYLKVTYEQAPPPGDFEDLTGVVTRPMDTIYTAPKASATGEGTIDQPMSIASAILNITPGGTIYCSGHYLFDNILRIHYGNNGEDGKTKKIICEDGTVFDFSAQEYGDTATNARGLQIDGNYWYVKGLEAYKSADNGFFIAGNHNTLELCTANANRDTGIQISRRASDVSDFNEWPSDNLILNCTSFNNFDPATGENADGFAAKLTCGEGNVFDGCIAYNNCDDGWDCFTKTATGPIGSLVLRNCVAFRSGQTTENVFTENSDGNGFKMGGTNIAVEHTLINCIAFENANHGFTDNSNPGPIYVENCTSFNNALKGGTNKSNFDFARHADKSFNYLTNSLSFTQNKISSDKFIGEVKNSAVYNKDKGNYYYFSDFPNVSIVDKGGETLPSDIMESVTEKTFVSIASPALGEEVHKTWRNADGSVNMGNFLKIADGTSYQELNIGADLSGEPIVLPSPTPKITPAPEASPTPTSIPTPKPDYELKGYINSEDNVIYSHFLNNTDRTVNSIIILAIYREGILIDVLEKQIDTLPDKTNISDFHLSNMDFDNISIYAWNDLHTLTPLTDSVDMDF